MQLYRWTVVTFEVAEAVRFAKSHSSFRGQPVSLISRKAQISNTFQGPLAGRLDLGRQREEKNNSVSVWWLVRNIRCVVVKSIRIIPWFCGLDRKRKKNNCMLYSDIEHVSDVTS